MTLKKNLVSSLTITIGILVPVAVISMMAADRASAQNNVPSNPAILLALQTLQQQLDELRPRKFYLTVDTFDGAEAPAACASGFHMASIWEVLDPTGLRYDTTRGFTRADSGSGPPSDDTGWIRTGYVSSAGGSLVIGPGEANCQAYTSNNPEDTGSITQLQDDWEESTAGDVAPWEARVVSCDSQSRVWCVQD